MPARGLPTRLRTLSMPDWTEKSPTSRRAFQCLGRSSSLRPRIWRFWRVVMSPQASTSQSSRLPVSYSAMTSATTRHCLVVTMPLGTRSLHMKVPGACLERWKSPSHLRRQVIWSSSMFWAPPFSMASAARASISSMMLRPGLAILTFSCRLSFLGRSSSLTCHSYPAELSVLTFSTKGALKPSSVILLLPVPSRVATMRRPSIGEVAARPPRMANEAGWDSPRAGLVNAEAWGTWVKARQTEATTASDA
mmetsp:Transcript_32011/g.62504  ORF Transcript_32011/g.62504 Transcript_32011/m.62504 type:complete len:250 (+) Transcript_32011:1295-2044(+)